MMRIANKVLIFLAVYLILFSAVQMVSFIITGQEQTQLIESTFLVFGIEVGGLLAKRVFDKLSVKRSKRGRGCAEDTENEKMEDEEG